MPEALDRPRPDLATWLNQVEATLDQLRQALREGAMFNAVDLADTLRVRVINLASRFPEEP